MDLVRSGADKLPSITRCGFCTVPSPTSFACQALVSQGKGCAFREVLQEMLSDSARQKLWRLNHKLHVAVHSFFWWIPIPVPPPHADTCFLVGMSFW